ncbi:MAG: hypothetical protein HRT89_05895 [Lentisphaeria bacterium]|nr:hypothetical protein [Lentisphaeria bacterium]NQZ67584.1 hypothetical protein [Lentisphaeria bacterium]
MKNYFPEDFSETLFELLDIDIEYLPDDCYEAIFKLNKHWVKGAELVDYHADESTVLAYTLYYMPMNIPKLWSVLARCHKMMDSLIHKDKIRVVDIGSGPGTFSWALYFYLKEVYGAEIAAKLDFTLIDQSDLFLDKAKDLHTAFASETNLELKKGQWQDLTDASYDLAIVANILTEEADLSATCLNNIDAESILILEPGTQRDFQRLLPLRAELMKNRKIHFPCTAHGDCPMAEDNWCHFNINRFVLPFIQMISNKAGRLNHKHNFCAFVFSEIEIAYAKNDWRVLSKLRRVKRSGIRWICDGEDLVEAVLNRRKKSPGNTYFLEADTMALIRIEQESLAKTGRIAEGSTVNPPRQ